jgi:hypothetical protein
MINIMAANPEARVPKRKKRERRIILAGRGDWDASKNAMGSLIRRCQKDSQAILRSMDPLAVDNSDDTLVTSGLFLGC